MAVIKTRADYYKETKWFSIMQPNPTEPANKSKKGDCVIRAFSIAADLTWLQAFDVLVENARKTYNVPNGQQNYEQVFTAWGFTISSIKAVKGEKRMTVEGFCKSHPKGRYIVSVANHLTAVVDSVCYDTWNPANKCVYKVYKLTDKELYNGCKRMHGL